MEPHHPACCPSPQTPHRCCDGLPETVETKLPELTICVMSTRSVDVGLPLQVDSHGTLTRDQQKAVKKVVEDALRNAGYRFIEQPVR